MRRISSTGTVEPPVSLGDGHLLELDHIGLRADLHRWFPAFVMLFRTRRIHMRLS